MTNQRSRVNRWIVYDLIKHKLGGAGAMISSGVHFIYTDYGCNILTTAELVETPITRAS